MTARQRSIASKIERMIATAEAHVDVDCRLLRIYERIIRVSKHDGINPKYATKVESSTEIDGGISQKYVGKGDVDNAQVDNDQELVIGGEDTIDSNIGNAIGHLKQKVEVYHPLVVEESEEQTGIKDESLERESSAERSENTEDNSPMASEADAFRINNEPSENEAEQDTDEISTIGDSSQGKSIRSFYTFSDRDIDTPSSITDVASGRDTITNRQPEIDETKIEYPDSERTRVTTIDEESCDVKSIVKINTNDERVGTRIAYSTGDSRYIPFIERGTSDGFVITDISESSTFTNADPTDSTFDGDGDNGDELGSEHRPPDFESTEVPEKSYSDTPIQYQLTHVDCNIVTCGNAPRRCTYDSDCLMTHAFRSACLAFCNYVSLFHSTNALDAVEINTGANKLAELIGHRDLVEVSYCSTRDAFPWLTTAGQCRDRLQTKHNPTSQAVCGGELVTEQNIDSEENLIHIDQSAHNLGSVTHVSSPSCNHNQVSSPSCNHIVASSPSCDHSQASSPSCDHSQTSSPRCDLSQTSSPSCDHIKASVPSCDQSQASSPSCGHSHTSSPRCDLSHTSSRPCDLSQASLERLDAASKARSRDCDRKIDTLEIQLLRLETRLLMEAISRKDESAAIVKLENKVLWFENRVQQMSCEMEAKQDDKLRQQNEAALMRNIEVMGERFIELTNVLGKQAARIRHLEKRGTEAEVDHRAFYKASLKDGVVSIPETKARSQFNTDHSDPMILLPPDIVVQDREAAIPDSGRPETVDSHVLREGVTIESEVNARQQQTSFDNTYENGNVLKQNKIGQNESINNTGESEREMHTNSRTRDNLNKNHETNLITRWNYEGNEEDNGNGISEIARVMQNRQRIIKSDTPDTHDAADDGTTKDDNTFLEPELRKPTEGGIHAHHGSFESPHPNDQTEGSGSEVFRPKSETPQTTVSTEELNGRTPTEELNVKERREGIASRKYVDSDGESKKQESRHQHEHESYQQYDTLSNPDGTKSEQESGHQHEHQSYQQYDTLSNPDVTKSQLHIGNEAYLTTVQEQKAKQTPPHIRSDPNAHTSAIDKRTGEDSATQKSRISGVPLDNSPGSVTMTSGTNRPLASNTSKPAGKRKGKRHQFKIPDIPRYTKRGHTKPKGR